MRAKIREILEECIEKGIEHGHRNAHKHHPDPPDNHIFSKIEEAIWLEIDERFDFERNVYSEVMEGLDHLPKYLRPKLLHPLEQEEEPRDGEIRAVNYITGGVEDGWPIFKHRLEQYYSGEWREIRVYQEDEDGKLSAREIDRLRAKKKQIYEDLKDEVEREWVGLENKDRFWIIDDWQELTKSVKDIEFNKAIRLSKMIEAKLKEMNT